MGVSTWCEWLPTAGWWTFAKGGEAPFGILMFAGLYDCLMIPNHFTSQREFKAAFDEAQEFVRIDECGKDKLAPPTDNRCSGCHWGQPRKYMPGLSITILKNEPLEAKPVRAMNGKAYHSHCGDRFNWVPPQNDAVQLQIAKKT